MRGSTGGTNASSRFTMDYEAKSMYEGIAEDLGGTVGQQVDWFRWQDYYVDDNYSTVVDDVYDTSSGVTNAGRRWMLPFKLPTVMAQLIRSSNVMNERGFYVTDTLRLVVNVGDAQRLIPEMINNPSAHIKDRIVYLGEVYVPTRVLPRGSFGNRWAVVTIDCNQVNPEELVNDPQFQNYAAAPTPDRRSLLATLEGLSFGGNHTLSPAFSKTIFSYTLTASTADSTVTATPVATDTANTYIVVNGSAVESGYPMSVYLPTTTTTVSVVVTAANGTPTNTYSVIVTKV